MAVVKAGRRRWVGCLGVGLAVLICVAGCGAPAVGPGAGPGDKAARQPAGASGTQAGQRMQLTVAANPPPAQWMRPAAGVPLLSVAPAIDGAKEAVWDEAAPVALRFAIGSAKAEEKPDTRAWIGHRDGTLYILVEMDWHEAAAPVAAAKGRDRELWKDDGVEMFLARAEDYWRPIQLAFNWAGTMGDMQCEVTADCRRVIKTEANWNPDWQLKIGQGEGVYRAEVAVPFKLVDGLAGERGEVLRCDLVRNRAKRQPSELHWAPIEGKRSLRPDYFGFLVLMGAGEKKLPRADLKITRWSSVVLAERDQETVELTGQAVELTALDPLHAIVTPAPTAGMKATLGVGLNYVGKVNPPPALEAPVASKDGVIRLRVSGGHPDDGECAAFVEAPGTPEENKNGRLVGAAMGFRWEDVRYIPADDPDAFVTTGRVGLMQYPRTVAAKVLSLGRKSSLQFTVRARAIALRLPPVLPLPGPAVGSTLMQSFHWKIDDGEWQFVQVATAPEEFILANDLALGRHVVMIETREDEEVWLAGFRISGKPLTRVHGLVHSYQYDELMVDVRAELFNGTEMVGSELLHLGSRRDTNRIVRSPHNGAFELIGVAAGDYTLRISAAGWEPVQKGISIPANGTPVDVGLWVLNRAERLNVGKGDVRPRFGQALCVTPGGGWSMVLPMWEGPPTKVTLVSRFKRIELPVAATEKIDYGQWNSLAKLSGTLPADVPMDMYDLELTFTPQRGRPWTSVSAQAVCVRGALPDKFMLAGCGHMNTWGQETSEYLARVGAIAELAGARELLVANEVNPAYVSGALANLRIPYLACSGNHTLGRWDEFYGAQPTATDDGPMRLVSFGRFPYESWADVERLFGPADGAGAPTARVVNCFEGFAPAEMIGRAKIQLLFDGHSDDPHPEAAKPPAGVLQVRAPTQESLRLIPMTATGLAVIHADECRVLTIPREGPSPLRVEESSDFSEALPVAVYTVVNEFEIPFEAAQVRMVLDKGKFAVEGATVVQMFESDDRLLTVIDATVAVPAKGKAVVKVRLTQPR